ncbi:hypothetical protein TL16_g00982 [Triparma laevis f. inornata]|uniref:SANT domain-containing protein n=1 Tax=Triparma laevis f. inornata TaxID=1714386 RepID=A0A9W6ZHT0_9STRA|nr:hypothetical protein TL16_g00982 [Triparma laevis f. inornata]
MQQQIPRTHAQNGAPRGVPMVPAGGVQQRPTQFVRTQQVVQQPQQVQFTRPVAAKQMPQFSRPAGAAQGFAPGPKPTTAPQPFHGPSSAVQHAHSSGGTCNPYQQNQPPSHPNNRPAPTQSATSHHRSTSNPLTSGSRSHRTPRAHIPSTPPPTNQSSHTLKVSLLHDPQKIVKAKAAIKSVGLRNLDVLPSKESILSAIERVDKETKKLGRDEEKVVAMIRKIKQEEEKQAMRSVKNEEEEGGEEEVLELDFEIDDGDGDYIRTATTSQIKTTISEIITSNKLKAQRAVKMTTDATLLEKGGEGRTERIMDSWTRAARKVEGPANALYIQPSKNPLFKRTSQKFQTKSTHDKICSHIWRNQRRLRETWLNLALKFVRDDKTYRVQATRDKAIQDVMFAISQKIKQNIPLEKPLPLVAARSFGVGGAGVAGVAGVAGAVGSVGSVVAGVGVTGFGGVGGVGGVGAVVPGVGGMGGVGGVGGVGGAFGSSLGMSASSTSRAARGARRSIDGKAGDFGGNELEHEQFLKEILRAEAFEKRIANGKMAREKIPRQIIGLERSMAGKFIDTGFTRRVDDGWKEEEAWENVNPWSDIEKAIFVDKFCQWPKNFRKIGGFLRNKSTGDCIAFYYASKKFINYKLLLREYSNRRRARENTLVYEVDQWSSTLAASKSVGATVLNMRNGKYRFKLPDENQYSTLNHHPPRGPVRDAFLNAGLHNLVLSSSKPTTPVTQNKRMAFTEGGGVGAPAAAVATPNSPKAGKQKMKVQKWTQEEKDLFVQKFSVIGKNWPEFYKLFPNKTKSSIKNFFQNYKEKLGMQAVFEENFASKSELRAIARARVAKEKGEGEGVDEDGRLEEDEDEDEEEAEIMPVSRRAREKKEAVGVDGGEGCVEGCVEGGVEVPVPVAVTGGVLASGAVKTEPEINATPNSTSGIITAPTTTTEPVVKKEKETEPVSAMAVEEAKPVNAPTTTHPPATVNVEELKRMEEGNGEAPAAMEVD